MQTDLGKTIGQAARHARAALDLTQADAAERIGISTEFYARIERGGAMPSVPTLAKMAEELDIAVDTLLGRGSNSPPSRSKLTRARTPNQSKQESPELRRLFRRLRGAPQKTLRLVSLLVAAMAEASARKRPAKRHS
ncbi:MAG TPA: helix-turn-helix transcriptional regulator [Polyangiaceae bacterium]